MVIIPETNGDDSNAELTSVQGNAGTVRKRSEEFQQIVSEKPGFVIRWANAFFFLVFMSMIGASWFIKYPETIDASAKLSSINAPKTVLALVKGKIIKLDVVENQTVHKGQILGYVESMASHEEVLTILSKVDSIQVSLNTGNTGNIRDILKSMSMQLGELQTAHQQFFQASLSFDNYLPNGFYLKKKTMLLNDRTNLHKLHKTLVDQKDLHEQDVLLAQATFQANESLKQEKVLSDFDYRMEKSKLINKKMSLPQIDATILNNENFQNEKEKEIIELENTIKQQTQIFQQAVNIYKSQIFEWKRKYILTAPVTGRVAFASFIQKDQEVDLNQIICFIHPVDTKYFAEIIIPQANLGKVATGQQVLLRFQSYSFQEYGLVLGRIEFISSIPADNGYLGKVIFTEGLKTTHGKEIQYRDGLLASAEIITQDMRLLQRFYYNTVRYLAR